MPGTYRAPGVYIEELPSGVHPVVGVSTSSTAFVDVFATGPVNRAVKIEGQGAFERTFGGVWPRSEASYAISQFFVNGGSTAWVVRVAPADAAPATGELPVTGGGKTKTITVTATSPGAWGNALAVAVMQTADATFDLVVGEVATVLGKARVAVREVFRALSADPANPRYYAALVTANSGLVGVTTAGTGTIRPADTLAARTDNANPPQPVPGVPPLPADLARDTFPGDFVTLAGGDDGTLPGDPAFKAADLSAALVGTAGAGTGLWALDTIAPDVFNIACLPAMALLDEPSRAALLAQAEEFCADRRAMLLVDPPASLDDAADPGTLADAMAAFAAGLDPHPNAAVYLPRLVIPDPANANQPRAVGPSGTVAGIWARTDDERGVWKAPAGTDATLRGADLVAPTTEATSERFNPLGINVLRTFPVYNDVVWGSRTLAGADLLASQWKYVPVRRTALYIEESLRQALQWVVFEPNDEALWAQIRLNVGSFMQRLFRLGAFAGQTPNDAYLVKCDADTTTADDIARGVVNILVGFLPVLPSEFVVIQIQQLTQPSEA